MSRRWRRPGAAAGPVRSVRRRDTGGEANAGVIVPLAGFTGGRTWLAMPLPRRDRSMPLPLSLLVPR